MIEDQRKSSRRRTLKAAKIMLAGGGSIDCVVRTASGAGGSLDVETPVGIPDRFELVITKDGVSRFCRVVWRQAKRIGVRFD